MFQPRRFGKYTLVERIAVGGMAEVFRARAPGLKAPVVVKQILAQYARDPHFVEMFLEEAKLSVMLVHDNIVGVYELGRIQEMYFLVMEYVHGRDLAEVLQASTDAAYPMQPEMASYIAQEICYALDYAHSRTDARGRPLGIVHRDLTPPNVLISFDGYVKLADFGIAKAADRLTRTEVGVVRGTQGYMSPEQAAGLDVDARSDIFSVGVLLWEMLTAQRLFVERGELLKLRQGERPAIAPPSSHSPHIPPELDEVVMRALAPQPGDRYANASEMSDKLETWLHTRSVTTTPATLGAYMRTLFREHLARQSQSPDAKLPTIETQAVDAEIFAKQSESRAGRTFLWATVVVLALFIGLLVWRVMQPEGTGDVDPPKRLEPHGPANP